MQFAGSLQLNERDGKCRQVKSDNVILFFRSFLPHSLGRRRRRHVTGQEKEAQWGCNDKSDE